MITTKREVDIENGVTSYAGHAVTRVSTEARTVSVPSEVEVKPYGEKPVAVPTERKTVRRVTARIEEDELMPVIRKSEEVEQAEEKTEARALSSKEKAMVFVYMAASLILALIVLITGLAITGATKEVNALESEVRTQSAVLAEANELLAHYSDDLTITGAATEMGMVKSSGATEVELIELTSAASYKERTNAFDKFCDFLSKIIGG